MNINFKHKKKESVIKRTIMEILINDIQSEYDLKKVVVEEIELYKDYSGIKIYTNFINLTEKEEKKYLEFLNKNSYYIRNELLKKINLKKVPKIFFEIDKSFKNAQNIEELLKKINKK